MAWVRSMNSIHNRAEEIVLAELVYCVREGTQLILEAMYNGEFYPCETVVPRPRNTARQSKPVRR